MRTILLISLLLITSVCIAQDAEKRLKELNIELLKTAPPIGNYVKAVRTGNLIFLSGHGPVKTDGAFMTGKVGKDATLEQGYAAARQTAISAISTLKAELGDLNKVKRIVKVLGMVNCTETFTRSTQSYKWIFRFDRKRVWSKRASCPFSRWCYFIAA